MTNNTPNSWEDKFHKIFFTIDTPEIEGKIFAIEQKVKSFIKSLLAEQKKEMVEMCEGMRIADTKWSEEDEGWNAALDYIIKKLG